MLSRVFKDIFPRYRTMCGYFVERKAGWDCHGLPVELAVEEELGFTSKADIERYGIAEFNARCREIVLSHVEDWNAMTERIGFWIDLDHAYQTLDTKYIESVWWALKTIHDRGLLFERLKVVPYCPRDRSRSRATSSGSPASIRTSSTRRYTFGSCHRARRPCSQATNSSSGRRLRGRSSRTPPSPSTRS